MDNNKNHENPAIKAWKELRITYQAFSDRMKLYDDMVEKQGININAYQVYTEIQNIKQQLDKIQNELILNNNTNYQYQKYM